MSTRRWIWYAAWISEVHVFSRTQVGLIGRMGLQIMVSGLCGLSVVSWARIEFIEPVQFFSGTVIGDFVLRACRMRRNNSLSQRLWLCMLFPHHALHAMPHWNYPNQSIKIRSLRRESSYIWVFPKIRVPQNEWFIRENPIKMDDLGVPLCLETPISWSIVWYSPTLRTPICACKKESIWNRPRPFSGKQRGRWNVRSTS